jgi:GTP-binding protein
MIDFARITVKAGDGGRGAGSFRKIKGKRYGKADGGDGGHGGDVYIEATDDVNTLEKYRFVKDYQAQRGQNGFSNLRRGARGEDLILKVPVGTQIKVAEESNVYDLAEDGQLFLVARGGEGGRGNAHLRDEFGRRPKTGEAGEAGEYHELVLELKLIADIGFVGLPNAGKSTLISKITAARPKIAAYPFTTLEANLGVFESDGKRLVIADIPGLIEGASSGRGLGDLFLRHIERTKVLAHLIDITSADLWRDYQTIRSELKNYSKELIKKKEIIVLTKADLLGDREQESAVDIFRKHRKKVLVVSTISDFGITDLRKSFAGIF